MQPGSMGKLSERYDYYSKSGCENKEMRVKVLDMKRRIRIAGMSLKSMVEANGAAFLDLHKEPSK